jgi:hypothetical protein
MVEDKAVKSRTKLKGRPTNQEGIKIKEDIEKAFNKGWGVLYAAEQLKYNKETVSLHYIELREKLIEAMDKNFINEQRTAKYFAIKKLQERIGEIDLIMHDAFDHKSGETNIWHSTIIHCIEVKASLEQAMHALEMTPTIDIDVEKMIQESRQEVAIPIRDTGTKTK